MAAAMGSAILAYLIVEDLPVSLQSVHKHSRAVQNLVAGPRRQVGGRIEPAQAETERRQAADR
jgi:hypothetical protein